MDVNEHLERLKEAVKRETDENDFDKYYDADYIDLMDLLRDEHDDYDDPRPYYMEGRKSDVAAV